MTEPHAIIDGGLEGRSVSQTTTFMQSRLREMEEARGTPATDGDRLQAYREWDDYKDKRFVKRVTIAATSIGTLGAAIFGVWILFKGPAETKPAEVLEKVESSAAEERKRNTEAASVGAHNDVTLAEMAVEQQQLTVEVVEHLGKKIEAAHPRQAEALSKVEKPQSLKDAEKALADRKKKSAAGDLLEKLPAPE